MVRHMNDGLRVSRASVAILAFSLAVPACDGPDAPEAGQTGSPVVSPDHESPGRFRPPVETPPGGGEAPELPALPLEPPKRTASFGAWLYIAANGGLFARDTSAPSTGAPAAQLLPHALPLWVAVEGSALSVIASVLPDDPADVERRGQLTRLYRFDLSIDPGAPELIGSVDLPGQLAHAHLESGRLIALSAQYAEPSCQPSVGSAEGWSAPERFTLSDFRVEGNAWSLMRDSSVEADGFIETEDAIVLVRGGYSGIPSELTVLEIGADALTASASLNVGGETLPGAAMAVAEGRLALFQNGDTGMELKVYSLSGGAPAVARVEVSSVQSAGDGIHAARFAGRFVLVPRTTSETIQPGVIIDWLREPGPAVTAELPADLPNVAPIGDRFLAWGPERSVVFRVGPEGSFDVERELGRPFEGREDVGMHWDLGAQRVTLAYILTGSGVGSQPAEYALSILELASAEPAWRGLRTAARPTVAEYYGAGFARESVQIQRTGSGSFALTSSDELFGTHWLLEALDFESAQSEVIGFSERTVAASLSAAGAARLLADYRGTRAVSLSARDGNETDAEHIALGFGAERLERRGDGWLSYSLTYDNACSDPEMFVDGVCSPSGTAALSQLGSDPPRLVRDTQLPVDDTFGAPPAEAREWIELLSQADEVGLLAHRGIRCRSQSECDTLGISFESDEQSGRDMCDGNDGECLERAPEIVQRGFGYQNQRWLHPYDSATGEFRAPVRLPDIDGHGWLSANGLRAEDQPALVWLDPLEIAADGHSVALARIQLVRFPSLLEASSENMERITVPGFPLYVAAQSALSIEPASVLDGSGGSVGARLHRLSLRDGSAYIEQTLELPSGHAGHLWAEQRGYVLLIGDDRCAEPSATVVSVRLNGGVLEEAGRLVLPGTGWQLAQASDELVLLTRTQGDLTQHALLDAQGAELTLRGYETRPTGVAASVFHDRVWFAP